MAEEKQELTNKQDISLKGIIVNALYGAGAGIAAGTAKSFGVGNLGYAALGSGAASLIDFYVRKSDPVQGTVNAGVAVITSAVTCELTDFIITYFK